MFNKPYLIIKQKGLNLYLYKNILFIIQQLLLMNFYKNKKGNNKKNNPNIINFKYYEKQFNSETVYPKKKRKNSLINKNN